MSTTMFFFQMGKGVGQFEKNQPDASTHQVGQEEIRGVFRALSSVAVSHTIHRFCDSVFLEASC